MLCTGINPKYQPAMMRRNAAIEIPMRHVSALAVRSVCPLSLIKKKSPLPKLPTASKSKNTTKIFMVSLEIKKAASLRDRLAHCHPWTRTRYRQAFVKHHAMINKPIIGSFMFNMHPVLLSDMHTTNIVRPHS